MTEISRFFLLSLTVAYVYLWNYYIYLWDKTVKCSVLGLPYWLILDLIIIKTIFYETFLNILILNQCPFIFSYRELTFFISLFIWSLIRNIYMYIYIHTYSCVYIKFRSYDAQFYWCGIWSWKVSKKVFSLLIM